jgi:hypothetical protein
MAKFSEKYDYAKPSSILIREKLTKEIQMNTNTTN